MPDITNQLQKTALNERSNNQDRINKLVNTIEQTVNDGGDLPSEEWQELKSLLNVKAEQPEEKEEQPEEETVASLVKNNTAEELDKLAEERQVDISGAKNKTEVAQAIINAKK